MVLISNPEWVSLWSSAQNRLHTISHGLNHLRGNHQEYSGCYLFHVWFLRVFVFSCDGIFLWGILLESLLIHRPQSAETVIVISDIYSIVDDRVGNKDRMSSSYFQGHNSSYCFLPRNHAGREDGSVWKQAPSQAETKILRKYWNIGVFVDLLAMG